MTTEKYHKAHNERVNAYLHLLGLTLNDSVLLSAKDIVAETPQQADCAIGLLCFNDVKSIVKVAHMFGKLTENIYGCDFTNDCLTVEQIDWIVNLLEVGHLMVINEVQYDSDEFVFIMKHNDDTFTYEHSECDGNNTVYNRAAIVNMLLTQYDYTHLD